MRGIVWLWMVAAVGSAAQTIPGQMNAGGTSTQPATANTGAAMVTVPAGSPAPSGGNAPGGYVDNPYEKEAPTFVLIPKTGDARKGSVWVRSDETGLHIWGRVDGAAPQWPAQRSEMLAKDHVEVWLAAAPEVTMPLVGWGNQFGKIEMKSAEDCKGQTDPQTGSAEAGGANCVRWYGEQVKYRAHFKRLFARQWLLAGSPDFGDAHATEEYATDAYRTLEGYLFREFLPEALKPGKAQLVKGGVSVATNGTDAAGNPNQKNAVGYRFYVGIPWEAFPPVEKLDVGELWLMVDVFSAAPAGKKTGAYATTSATREWGQPASFNHVKLDAARGFTLSPCEDALVETNIYDDPLPAWFFPVKAGEKATWVGKDFIVTNPAGGYDYAPTGVSPEAEEHSHFWKPIAGGGWVCGPRLAVKRAGVTKGFPFVVDEKTLEAKVLGDGWLLVRSGPSASTVSNFGSGACGACTVAHVDFYVVSPAGEVTPALQLSPTLGAGTEGPDAADFAIASDWMKVTEYDEKASDDGKGEPAWSSTTFCFAGHAFARCAEAQGVKPPSPANYPEFAAQQ